jgi:hypothetical protein
MIFHSSKILAQGLTNPIWSTQGLPTPVTPDVIFYRSKAITYLEWFIGIFWVVTVGFVIWAAFLYLTAGGNEEKVSEAKRRLLYAVIAGAIALLATGIDLIVFNLLSPS